MIKNGGCGQLCVNIQGSYGCRCKEGYRIEADNKSCKGMSENRVTQNFRPIREKVPDDLELISSEWVKIQLI